jgi:hypothetical protein
LGAEGRDIDDSEIVVLFGQIAEDGSVLSRREALRIVAEQLGLPVRAVYQALERAKTQPA